MSTTHETHLVYATADGILCSSLRSESLNLDHRTHEDHDHNDGALSGVGYSCNSATAYTGLSDSEVFTESRPCGPCHRVSITVLHDEVEAALVYQDDDFVSGSRSGKVSRRRESGELSPEDKARSVSRTRKTMRHKIMMMQADGLMTLTTGKAITDIDEMHALMRRFNRKMRKLLASSPHGFRYVSVLERHESGDTSDHKRGSYHAHLAISGFVSYKQVWRLFDACVVEQYGEGERKNSRFHMQRRVARVAKSSRKSRIAAYMCKYIAKTFDDAGRLNKKRYWSSSNIEKPLKIVLYMRTGIGCQSRFLRFVEGVAGRSVVRQFDSSQLPDSTAPPFLWVSTY